MNLLISNLSVSADKKDATGAPGLTSQVCVPSTTLSSTPVIVTVCAVFQLVLLNVSVPGATVPFPESPLLTPIPMLAEGWVVSRTVNVAVPPPPSLARSRT